MVRASGIAVLTLLVLAALVLLRPGWAQEQDRREDKQADSQPMQMQCPMMAGLKGINLFADSPAVLLAKAEELKLTDEQLEGLEQIQMSARQQARELLTRRQQEHLKDGPEGPLSLMQLSMQGMKGGNKSEQMCPMCMKMMRKGEHDKHHQK